MIYLNIQKAVNNVGNRFDLVLITSYYARQIQLYKKKFAKNKNKSTLIALKKIENNLFDKNLLLNFLK